MIGAAQICGLLISEKFIKIEADSGVFLFFNQKTKTLQEQELCSRHDLGLRDFKTKNQGDAICVYSSRRNFSVATFTTGITLPWNGVFIFVTQPKSVWLTVSIFDFSHAFVYSNIPICIQKKEAKNANPSFAQFSEYLCCAEGLLRMWGDAQ